MVSSSKNLTKEHIRAVYERGVEAVIDLVRQLQAEIVSVRKRVRELETPINYDRFLSYLDHDPDQASKKYYQLLKFLVRYLDSSLHSDDPEKHASETLDEISQRIGRGEKFDDLRSYSKRIARNIHISALRRRKEDTNLIDSPQFTGNVMLSNPPEVEQKSKAEEARTKLECMKSCYDQLPEVDYDLITRYSVHNTEYRKNMATELNIKLGALRVRINRIRERLGKCRQDCEEKLH